MTTFVMGYSGSVTIGQGTYTIIECDWKQTSEKLPYYEFGSDGWVKQMTGGGKDLSGTVTFAYSGSCPVIDTVVAMVINLDANGSKNLTFDAVLNEISGSKKQKGAVDIKCNFDSHGTVTVNL